MRPYIDLGGSRSCHARASTSASRSRSRPSAIVAVGLDYADSTLQVQPFAAPRSSGLWEETREQIRQQ